MLSSEPFREAARDLNTPPLAAEKQQVMYTDDCITPQQCPSTILLPENETSLSFNASFNASVLVFLLKAEGEDLKLKILRA